MTRCLLSTLLLCALLLAVVRLGVAAEVDLEKTTTVSLTVENQPLSTVLTKFAEQTGAPVIVDSFIETQKKKALARRINIDVKDRPYWEAADAIMDAADLQLERITRRGVALEPRSRLQAGNEKEKQAGKPVATGKFSVRPWYNNFFDEVRLVIRPEPGVAAPYLVDYRAELRFADGTTATYEPPFLIWVYDLEGELNLRIEEDAVGNHNAVARIDLEADLEVPTQWEEMTLPALGTMLPRPAEVGGGTLRIERFGLEEMPDPKHNEIGMKVHTTGVATSDDAGLDAFALVGPDGERIRAKKAGRSQGETNGVTWESYDLGFPPRQVRGDPQMYRLAIALEGGKEQIVGPIGEIVARRVEAGKTQVNLAKAELKNGELEILVYNFRIPYDRVWLDVGNGPRLEPVVLNGSSSDPFSYAYTFPVDDVQSDPASWQLVMEVPTKAVHHTLRATLHDVQIGE